MIDSTIARRGETPVACDKNNKKHLSVVRLSLQGHNLFVQIPLIKLSNNGHVLCPSLRLK